MQMHFDGDTEYQAEFTDAVDGADHAVRFSVGNVNRAEQEESWASYVMDPVDAMPEKLHVKLYHSSLSNETATLEIDVAGGSVTLQ